MNQHGKSTALSNAQLLARGARKTLESGRVTEMSPLYSVPRFAAARAARRSITQQKRHGRDGGCRVPQRILRAGELVAETTRAGVWLARVYRSR